MNGQCKIEIFNSDGTIDKVVKKNYITEGYKKQLELRARYGAVLGPDGNHDNAGFTQKYIEYLLLTNNTSVIDTADGVFIDTPVGICSTDKDDTSSNTKYGTYNAAESYQSFTKAKHVFDFPTDRGNGTFKTVHLALASTDPMSSFDALIPCINFKAPCQSIEAGAESYKGICHNSSNTFIVPANSTDKVYKFNKSNKSYIETISLSTAAVRDLQDITADDTYLYIATESSVSNSAIYKYQLDGTYVDHITIANLSGVVLIGSKLYYTTTVGGQAQFRSMNTNLTGSTLEGTINGFAPADYLATDGTNIYATRNNVNKSISKVETSTITVLENYGNPNVTVNGIDYEDGKIIGGIYELFELDIDNAFNVVSRVLLDTPVTKNNTQTMKVTYVLDFI